MRAILIGALVLALSNPVLARPRLNLGSMEVERGHVVIRDMPKIPEILGSTVRVEETVRLVTPVETLFVPEVKVLATPEEGAVTLDLVKKQDAVSRQEFHLRLPKLQGWDRANVKDWEAAFAAENYQDKKVDFDVTKYRMIGEVHTSHKPWETALLRSRLKKFKDSGYYDAIFVGWYGEDTVNIIEHIAYARNMGYKKVMLGIGRLEPYQQDRITDKVCMYSDPVKWVDELEKIIPLVDSVLVGWQYLLNIEGDRADYRLSFWRDWMVGAVRTVDPNIPIVGALYKNQHYGHEPAPWDELNLPESMSALLAAGYLRWPMQMVIPANVVASDANSRIQATGYPVILGPTFFGTDAIGKQDRHLSRYSTQGAGYFRLAGFQGHLGRDEAKEKE